MAAKDIEKHQYKKGQSGNPSGRPVGIPNAKTRYARLLSIVTKNKNPVTGDVEEFTQLELMDMQVFAKALKGDLHAYNSIMDRLEGKAQQSVDMTSEGEKIDPIVIYRPEKLAEGE